MLKNVIGIIVILIPVIGLTADNTIIKMHEQMLYPVVRITVGNSGGSGTVIYSEDRGDGCQTFILTNHHVIDDAIKVREEWDSLLQADVKRESNDKVRVEVFRYADSSAQDVVDTYRGEIVAHDKNHDLALVKLLTNRQLEYVAQLLPEEVKPAIFTPIWAIGCSLLHPPISTEGILNYLDDIIDRKIYWMGSAQIIYGNSGGSVYMKHKDAYYFIGVPSRVGVTYGQAVTHMGYFAPVVRVREWASAEELRFLLDKKSKPKDCFEKREEMRKQAKLKMMQHGSKSNKLPTLAPLPQ